MDWRAHFLAAQVDYPQQMFVGTQVNYLQQMFVGTYYYSLQKSFTNNIKGMFIKKPTREHVNFWGNFNRESEVTQSLHFLSCHERGNLRHKSKTVVLSKHSQTTGFIENLQKQRPKNKRKREKGERRKSGQNCKKADSFALVSNLKTLRDFQEQRLSLETHHKRLMIDASLSRGPDRIT